jgi:hypothetical protein
MKRWGFFLALMGAMLVTLSLSEQAADAARQGLALCAHSVVPSLFPFLYSPPCLSLQAAAMCRLNCWAA